MISVHCTSHSDVDRFWRMLAHVPEQDFYPADIYVSGEFMYQVIRTATGDQTTAQPAAQQDQTC